MIWLPYAIPLAVFTLLLVVQVWIVGRMLAALHLLVDLLATQAALARARPEYLGTIVAESPEAAMEQAAALVRERLMQSVEERHDPDR